MENTSDDRNADEVTAAEGQTPPKPIGHAKVKLGRRRKTQGSQFQPQPRHAPDPVVLVKEEEGGSTVMATSRGGLRPLFRCMTCGRQQRRSAAFLSIQVLVCRGGTIPHKLHGGPAPAPWQLMPRWQWRIIGPAANDDHALMADGAILPKVRATSSPLPVAGEAASGLGDSPPHPPV